MGATAHAYRSGFEGVRLTRRGRIVVISFVALVLLAGLWLGARRGAAATSGGSGRPASEGRESVVVRPDDTLWGVAVRSRPGIDPRIIVQRIIDLNALAGGIVHPGQRLFLPPK